MSLITDFLHFLKNSWIKVITPWLKDEFWPWFLEYVWPEIQKLILIIFGTVISDLKSKILEWLQKRNNQQEAKAKQKAEEASEKAKESQHTAEAEKWQAIAQVWREVAENFREENETLKENLDRMVNEAKEVMEDEIASINVDNLIEEHEDGSLRLKGSTTALLPPQFDQNSRS